MKVLLLTALSVVLSFFGEGFAQELYRWVDDKGIINFTDNVHSVPAKYRQNAEKRFLAPSPEVPTPAPQKDTNRFIESSANQPGVAFVRQGNEIVVEGFINQRGPISLVVDRTAPVTTLPISIAGQLGIDLKNSVPMRWDNGSVSSRLVTIDSFRVGDIEIDNLEIALTERGPSAFGILGMDSLGGFRVHLDHRSNWMRLVQEEGAYGGRSLEWWREKFRFYRELKQTYEQHLKRLKEEFATVQRLASFEMHVGDEARLKQILSGIKAYEGYLRLVRHKVDDLDRLASHAAVPRELRE